VGTTVRLRRGFGPRAGLAAAAPKQRGWEARTRVGGLLGADLVGDVRARGDGDGEHRRGGARAGERPACPARRQQRRRPGRVLDELLGQPRGEDADGGDRDLGGRAVGRDDEGAKTISGQCQR
jgi:hypothetical protein